MSGFPRAARRFIAATAAPGWLVLALVLASGPLSFTPHQDVLVCLLLAGLTFVGELRPIVIPRGDTRDTITVSTTFALALVLVAPLWLALLVMVTAVSVEDVRTRRGWVRPVFNVAQYALTLVAARVVFALLADQPLLQGAPLDLPGDLPAALAAGAAFFAVNNTLSGIVVALAGAAPVRAHLFGDLGFHLATTGVLLAFAPVVAAASQITLWLLPLLVLPILAVHRSAQLAADREHEALHDALTGLPNRALFRRRLERACEEAARTGRPFAVVLLDLDHFKDINDTLGHHVGDELLVHVAERLSGAVREQDTVARLGGDELVVLAEDLDGEHALLLAGRLLEELGRPFLLGEVRVGVSASAGVALHPEHGGADRLLSRADIALYAAKVSRGEVRLYDASQDVHTVDRLALAADLREGMERGELFLQHQPQVDVATGRTTGFEALVRWRHPQRGVVMPDQFLPVVENTGLITPLTLIVLDLALAAAASWRAAGHDVTVAVNLSARHLTDLDLPVHVEVALERHGLPASALVLEVTETLIMSDPARAAEVLRRLNDLGVALAVDDFGTGYSSLAYLRRLDVHELKIDRSFIRNVAHDEGDAVIVRSTIEMGRNLGLRLVAEGVEDEDALALLRSWGCTTAQGYLFSRPMDAGRVLSWLAEERGALALRA